MKIFIFLPNNNNGPCGGGNQFLNGLKDEFVKKNIYTNNINEATVVLFNSHHKLNYINSIKANHPNIKIFHRIDGLHQLWRKNGKNTDNMIKTFANNYADGVIFQSKWSEDIFKKHNIIINKKITIIPNAALDNIFKRRTKKLEGKIELITTCWSPGSHKGIEFYMFLDDNLDFDKYNYTYIGQIPSGYKFKNIIHLPPMDKNKLSVYLQKSDIFISGVRIDAASNSITEALTTGLPVLYFDAGGNKEIVKNGGVGFTSNNDIREKMDIIVKNYDTFYKNIDVPSIEDIANKYIDFFKNIDS
jgi:glycosyltransferase involved in cell wall biosynthesis